MARSGRLHRWLRRSVALMDDRRREVIRSCNRVGLRDTVLPAFRDAHRRALDETNRIAEELAWAERVYAARIEQGNDYNYVDA